MKRERASVAACWAPRHLRAPTRSMRIAGASIRTALVWKRLWRNAAMTFSGFLMPVANKRTPRLILSCTLNRARCWNGWGLPLAAVLGTKGVERHAITFHGQEAHSGSTPMNQRRDALAAAAKLALEIRSIAGKHSDSVCTMGSVKTYPGIVTAVVGRCEATLDQRDLDADILAAMYAEAQATSRRFAEEEHCTVDWSKIWNIEPVPFHPDAARSSAKKPCARRRACLTACLPDPLHDAAEVARAGIPAVMMFVQSLKGISHNKIEDTKEEHLEMAVAALDRLASKAAQWILKQ